MRLHGWFVDQSAEPDDAARVFALVAVVHWSLVSLLWSVASVSNGWALLAVPSPLPGPRTPFRAVLGILGFGLAVGAVARLYWRSRLRGQPNPLRGLAGGVVIWLTATFLWAFLISGVPQFLGHCTVSERLGRGHSIWFMDGVGSLRAGCQTVRNRGCRSLGGRLSLRTGAFRGSNLNVLDASKVATTCAL